MLIKSKQAEDHFDRGINYFRAGFFSSALKEFKSAQEVDPAYPNIDFILEACIKKNKEVAGKLTNFIEENFDSEVKTLSEELTFENSSHLGREVESLLRQDKPQEALQKLIAAEAIIPDSRPLSLLMGNIQRRLGMFKEAERTLRRALNIFPEDAEILNNLGNVYAAAGNYGEADEHFRAALRLSIDDPRVYNNLASLRMQTNNLDDAEKLFRKALKYRPGWQLAKKNLANLNLRTNALDKDIDSLRKEFINHPDYLDIGLALGKTLFFRGYFSEARTTLKKVVKTNPGLIQALFYLGAISELLDDEHSAIEFFREMVIRSGKAETNEFLNFESLLKQEFYEEALAELKKIAILDLDIAASRINLGIRYFEDCMWDDALRHFVEATKINDTYPDAFYWIALTQIQMNQKSKAKLNFTKALDLYPDYADAHFQLGMLLKGKSRKKAKEHLIKALELNLRPAFARIAEKILNEQK